MSYYKLYREKPDGGGVRGTLYMCQPTGLCSSSILVRAASTLENARTLIPALVYPVLVTLSPRFKKLLPLLRNVPGRTGIRIHGGIKPEHSQGCVLLNKKNEYQAVVSRMLYEQKQGEDIRIEIIDWYPSRPQPQAVASLKYTDYENIPTLKALPCPAASVSSL